MKNPHGGTETTSPLFALVALVRPTSFLCSFPLHRFQHYSFTPFSNKIAARLFVLLCVRLKPRFVVIFAKGGSHVPLRVVATTQAVLSESTRQHRKWLRMTRTHRK